jgi:hypothetical protein
MENENKDKPMISAKHSRLTTSTSSNRLIIRYLDFTQIRWSEEFEPGNRMPKTVQFPSVDQITKLITCDKEELKRLELVGLSFALYGFARLNFLLSNGMESNLKIDNPTELYALPTEFNKNSVKVNKN